jgi:hypothetical protein
MVVSIQIISSQFEIWNSIGFYLANQEICSLLPCISWPLNQPKKRVDHGGSPANPLLKRASLESDQHRGVDNPPLSMKTGAVIAPNSLCTIQRDVTATEQLDHVSRVVASTSVVTKGLHNSVVWQALLVYTWDWWGAPQSRWKKSWSCHQHPKAIPEKANRTTAICPHCKLRANGGRDWREGVKTKIILSRKGG